MCLECFACMECLECMECFECMECIIGFVLQCVAIHALGLQEDSKFLV